VPYTLHSKYFITSLVSPFLELNTRFSGSVRPLVLLTVRVAGRLESVDCRDFKLPQYVLLGVYDVSLKD
jgi:hypothetical protein